MGGLRAYLGGLEAWEACLGVLVRRAWASCWGGREACEGGLGAWEAGLGAWEACLGCLEAWEAGLSGLGGLSGRPGRPGDGPSGGREFPLQEAPRGPKRPQEAPRGPGRKGGPKKKFKYIYIYIQLYLLWAEFHMKKADTTILHEIA